MSRLIRRLSLWVLILFAATSGVARAQALPLFGTWKLNSAKSTLGGPPPQDALLLFVPIGADQLTGGEDTIYPDGSKTSSRYTLRVDGRDAIISGSSEILIRADTVALSRLDASTFVWLYKKNGISVLALRGVLAPNGRTLTMTAPDMQVLVYEKQ